MAQLTDDEKALIEEIDAAFKNVPHNGKDLGLSREIGGFAGKTRQEVTAQDIWRNASYLHCFSAKAIRYFLPCFLKFTFEGRPTSGHGGVERELVEFLANPDRLICSMDRCRYNTEGRQLKQFFAPDERAVIVAFLRQYGTSFPVKSTFRYNRESKLSEEIQKKNFEDYIKYNQDEQNELIIAAMDYWMTPPNVPFKSTKAGKNKKR